MSKQLVVALGAAGCAIIGALALDPLSAQSAPPKPPAFATCAACHTVTPGSPSTVGPNLWGVGKRKAAQAPGFRYSAAMKAQTFKWDRAKLIAFIQAPRTQVPGTSMTIGERDPKKAAALADYLLSLK